MRTRAFLSAVLVAGLVLGGLAWDVALAQAPWSDNFDSYAAGSQMIGQGGWTGWDNNPAVGALVSNALSRSNPNSVAITGATDLVHTYAGYTSGRAVYTAWQYIPNNFAGTTYFILMNQYIAGGAQTWSVQVRFQSATGTVVSDFDGNALPLIRGRWVQIRVEINLDTDTQTFYYDNVPLYTKSWRCGVSGCGPLPPNIAAVDLYANGASPVYYDDMSLDHATPSLALAKTITSGNPYSLVGGTIGYSYALTNTGNVALFPPYSVTDNQASVTCPAGPAYLSPGASVVCTASHTVTQADLNAGSVTNTATATARDAAAGGNAVTSNSSSQTATATQNRRLALTKSITSGNPYSTVGGTISYSYAVLNSGNISLAGPVTVSDSLVTVTCPAVNTVGNSDAFLDPGESLTCTASYTVLQADLNAGSVTNTASASAAGTPSNTDSETATANQAPELAILKTALPVTYNAVGQVISYSYLVTNTGNVTLSGPFTIADDRATDEACPATASVAPGAAITCTASYAITQADLNAGSVTNVAAASGSFGGNPVTSLTDTEVVTAVQTPALTIVKTALPATYDSVGDLISYSFLVTNSGNVTLSGPFSVSDDKASDEACPATVSLAPGAAITCTASYAITQADLNAGSVTNTATASNGPVTSAPDDETVTANQLPALNVTKTESSTGPYAVGSTITYSLVVDNTGNVTLTNVTVSDPEATVGVCIPAQPAALAPSASMTCPATYVVTQADMDAGSFTNTATADSTETPTDTDSETVTFTQSPALNVIKEVSANVGGPWSDTITVNVGDTVYYRIRAQNTGNTTLTGLTVDDGMPGCTLTRGPDSPGDDDAVFEVGETWVYTCNLVAVAGTQTNTATADSNETPQDSDDASYFGAQPVVTDPAVTKTGDPATAAIGDTVVFTLVVTNTGPGDADDVVVTDIVPSFLSINSVTVNNPLPPGSVDVTGNTITIDFGTLTPTATCPPASGTSCYVVTIQTTVNSSATPPGGTNTASLTLDPAATDADPDNNADSALTTIVVRSPSEAPETGFAPGRATLLPDQPSSSAYSQLGDLWLEIPALGIRRTITGVPRQAEGWDVKWLGDLAGYLEGTAFPTWSGNSVITGHVVLATGLPGPFARLDRLGYGDSIVVHAWGEQYRYEVRQVSLLKPTDSSIFRHEDRAWVTLVTCQGYDPKSETYRERRVVRAVLMEVDGEMVSAPPAMERGR